MNTINTKLLPCPFCGCKDTIINANTFEGFFSVQCTECDVMTAFCKAEEIAIRIWNTRVNTNLPDIEKNC